MTKDQEDILNMYQTTDGLLQTNNAIWSANVPFSAAVAALEANIDAIQNLWDQQEEDVTGIAVEKQDKRVILEKDTVTVGSIIVFYASVNKKPELLKKVNYTPSELTRARDSRLPGMSRAVHEEAVANSVALVPYGLTAGMITTLQSSLDAYVEVLDKPREAISDTSSATEQLPALFDDTDKILQEQLDKGIELFHASNLDFYTSYFNARIIVNSPTLKRALEVHFEDIGSGVPCGHAVISVDGTITRRSSDLGNIRVQSLTEGTHHLLVSLPGYDTAKVDFIVVSGETTKLEVKMTRVKPF